MTKGAALNADDHAFIFELIDVLREICLRYVAATNQVGRGTLALAQVL